MYSIDLNEWISFCFCQKKNDIRRDTPDVINGFHNDKNCSFYSTIDTYFFSRFVIVSSEIQWWVVVALAKGFLNEAGTKGGIALFVILVRLARKSKRKVLSTYSLTHFFNTFSLIKWNSNEFHLLIYAHM